MNFAEERTEEEAVTTGHSPRGVAEDKHSIVKGHTNVVLLMPTTELAGVNRFQIKYGEKLHELWFRRR